MVVGEEIVDVVMVRGGRLRNVKVCGGGGLRKRRGVNGVNGEIRKSGEEMGVEVIGMVIRGGGMGGRGGGVSSGGGRGGCGVVRVGLI